MRLEIQNIGKIDQATVELNGITVIAGPNNSAKSTVGKVLYCIFNSFYKLEEQTYDEKKDSIDNIIFRRLRLMTTKLFYDFRPKRIAHLILKNTKKYVENPDLLQSYLREYINKDNKEEIHVEDLKELVDDIMEVLKLPNDRILKKVITDRINEEFNGQINNIYSPEEEGKITLKIRNEDIVISIKDNLIVDISNNHRLNTEVIYLDDPYILDDIGKFPNAAKARLVLNHRDHLEMKLLESNSKNVVDKLIISDKFETIYQKLDMVCEGEMVRDEGKHEYGYRRGSTGPILDIKNISTGLKTFVIIKTLLQNGSLEENGTLILDEPEIHLHPRWQLILAEIIVLIQKEFGMHILVNTHSPYFLRAIEVYSANHEIADKCKYYLSENQGYKSVFQDVTTHTDLIYKKLASPLEKLQVERYSND